MIIKNEQIQMVHLSEINNVIFETPAVSITGVLLSELAKNKIGIVFCDERHLPQGHYVSLTSNYISALRIIQQSEWDSVVKDMAWVEIVKHKVQKQADVLKQTGHNNESVMLESYISDVSPGDITNREGFAAKVYFNALFGSDFARRDESIESNGCLDYGYAILLSIVAREIVKVGYELALGIHHKGSFNPNNLACDVMEPFRPIVDYLIVSSGKESLNTDMKKLLWNLGNFEVVYNGEKTYLNSAVSYYFRDICRFMENGGGVLPEYYFIW